MLTLFVITAWILTITALLGNCFVIFIIVTRRRLRSSKLNWYIVSLAVADVLVALSFYPPLFFCDRWFTCQSTFMRAFRWIFIYSSVCNLCAMIMDRYLAITSPIYHTSRVSERTVVICVTVSWLVPVLLRGVVFIPLRYAYKREALEYALPVLLVIFEALPCVFILFSALRISIIAKRKQLQRRNNPLARNNTNGANQRGSTALKMILFVAIFFIFCYSLEVYYAMCKHVLKLCEDTDILQMIRRLLLIANSAINPFAYAFLKRDIKEEVKQNCVIMACRNRNYELNTRPNTEANATSVYRDED